MSLGNSGLGPGSSSRMGFKNGNLDGRNNSFKYPSPWWDVAQMDLPRSVKSLFKWCRYHMLVNPLVAAVVRKMAVYPITKVIIDEGSQEGFDRYKNRWEDFLYRVLNVTQTQLEIGLDYYGYGNCIVSILYPFHKYLECRGCGFRKRITHLRYKKEWNFVNFKYTLNCPTCSLQGNAKVKDEFYKSYKDIRIIRWNPSDIEIDYNPITREPVYAYTVPPKVRSRIVKKNKRYLETMPQQLIDSLRMKKPFILTRENIFHFKSPTPSLEANEEGWGYPPILPALKDSYYLQIMKKAQEAVMLEHLVPLDIMFPASSDPNANPYLTINLSEWKTKIENELVRWRWDPNYKPILPVPMGHQRIGGNGKALMLVAEIRAWSEQIIAGMGVPQEFVFGGLSWSGSSVSMRMLENQFMNYRVMHEHFLQHFLIPNVARFMGWREIGVHMKAFKMADDMQAKQLMISLNQMRKISDKTLLAEFGKDSLDEARLIEKEMMHTLELQKMDALYKAQVQGESQQVSTKYQIDAQKQMMEAQRKQQADMAQQGGAPQPPPPPGEAPQPPEAPEQGSQNVNVIELAEAYARKIGSMEEQERVAVLQQMSSHTPQLHELVQRKLATVQAMAQKPLPEQRPPRRESKII